MSANTKIPQPLSLIPGPVRVSDATLEIYSRRYGSPDLDENFFVAYDEASRNVGKMIGAKSGSVVIQSGEAMVSLWGSIKSVLSTGDRVLSIATGVYGFGIADMCRSCGANVDVVPFDYDSTFGEEDVETIRNRARSHLQDGGGLKLITVVHCETPSGTLNPIELLGPIAREMDALLLVDMVSSAGSVPISVTDWNIDLAIVGSQKVLSLPPDLGIIAVSNRAWDAVRNRAYVGYDAILPFEHAVEKRFMPYTHNWAAVEALRVRTAELCANLDGEISRHDEVAAHCRKRLSEEMGLTLYAKGVPSPAVTSVVVPGGMDWDSFSTALRKRGVEVGGSYGALAGKVFRVGHMGLQADRELVDAALDVLQEILNSAQTT